MRKKTPTQNRRKKETKKDDTPKFKDEVKKIQSSIVRSVEADTLDDHMLKDFLVKMLLISLTDLDSSGSIPEMIRLSQEICKLKGLYASTTKVGTAKTASEEDEDDDATFNRMVADMQANGRGV